MVSRMQIDFKKYNADGIGSPPTTLPRVDFAALNQPWSIKSTTPMVLVHVYRFPNKQNHPHAIHQTKSPIPRATCPNAILHSHAIHPSKIRRGGACVPARTSAQRRFHTQMNEYNYTTHRGRKCIAHSRPHSLKQVLYANWHRDDALLF